MRTRNMNVRITFFSLVGGQNEDGEVVESVRKDLYSCWAEISKSSIKDFVTETRTVSRAEGSTEARDSKTFLIRHLRKLPFSNADYIEFDGLEYKVTAIQRDYASKDIDLISAVRVS